MKQTARKGEGKQKSSGIAVAGGQQQQQQWDVLSCTAHRSYL